MATKWTCTCGTINVTETCLRCKTERRAAEACAPAGPTTLPHEVVALAEQIFVGGVAVGGVATWPTTALGVKARATMSLASALAFYAVVEETNKEMNG